MALKDWYPGRRDAVIHMAKTWVSVLATEAADWNVPASEVTGFGIIVTGTEAMLQQAQSSARTQVITVQCNLAFRQLEEKMRFLKNHFFLIPPLNLSDFPLLLLAQPDTIKTPVPVPQEEAPTADVSYPGPHQVKLHDIRCFNGTVDPDWNWGVRIYWGLTGTPNDTHPYRLSGVPPSGRPLPESQYTKRKKESFDFPGESGNTVYFTLRYERGGAAGRFGPMLSVVIP